MGDAVTQAVSVTDRTAVLDGVRLELRVGVSVGLLRAVVHADADADAEPVPTALVLARALPHALAESLDEAEALRVRRGDAVRDADDDGLRDAGGERDDRGLTLGLDDSDELGVPLELAQAVREASKESVGDTLGVTDPADDADTDGVGTAEVLAAADAVGVVDEQLLCVALTVTMLHAEPDAVAVAKLLELIDALGQADDSGLAEDPGLPLGDADSDVELLAHPLAVELRVILADTRGDAEPDPDSDAGAVRVAPAEPLAAALKVTRRLLVAPALLDAVASAENVLLEAEDRVAEGDALSSVLSLADVLDEAAALAVGDALGECDGDALADAHVDSVAAVVAVFLPEPLAVNVAAADERGVALALLLDVAAAEELVDPLGDRDGLAEPDGDIDGEGEFESDGVGSADTEGVGRTDIDCFGDMVAAADALPLAQMLTLARRLSVGVNETVTEVQSVAVTRAEGEEGAVALIAAEALAPAEEHAEGVQSADKVGAAVTRAVGVPEGDCDANDDDVALPEDVAQGVGDVECALDAEAELQPDVVSESFGLRLARPEPVGVPLANGLSVGLDDGVVVGVDDVSGLALTLGEVEGDRDKAAERELRADCEWLPDEDALPLSDGLGDD